MIQVMDETGLGVVCNMDGGFGKTFEQNMKLGEPYRDRIIHFARLNFQGIKRRAGPNGPPRNWSAVFGRARPV